MTSLRPTVAAALCLIVFSAHAEKGDRDKPINLEADRVSLDDINKVQIFEGNVVLTQGTMQVKTAKLVVTQDPDGFQKSVATGGPGGLAHFRQKRDGSNEYMEGEGERVVHDARSEKTEFFGRAWVRNGDDEVRGHYISYDAISEKYLVTNNEGATKSATGSAQARVRAIIQPKNKPATPDNSGGAGLSLKPSTTTSPER